MFQSDRGFLAEEEKIIRAVDFADYDVEGAPLVAFLVLLCPVYARRLEEIVEAKIAKLTQLKGLFADRAVSSHEKVTCRSLSFSLR